MRRANFVSREFVLVIVLLLSSVSPLFARTFYAVPGKGSAKNPGTDSKPWGGLEKAIQAGRLAELDGGDRILLGSGYHGHVTLSGTFERPVTVEPLKDQSPKLGRLTIEQGENWIVRGLSISPSYGKRSYDGYMVTLAEGGESREIVLENCYVHTTDDTSNWGVEEWKNANNGILAGRHGKRIVLRNNDVRNTRFGISLSSYHALCEGNVISGFSADGIRVTRDGGTVRQNVVKNVFLGSEQGDDNHDDAIQCFLFNEGTGTVRNVTVRSNIILNQEDWDRPYATQFHGIGFFDGPLVNFTVENNLVAVRHWHGISLYDAQNCKIRRNVVFNPWGDQFTAWIKLGSKKGKPRGNTVVNNYAHQFDLNTDENVTAKNNNNVTETIFRRKRQELRTSIEARFGSTHPVSGNRRFHTDK